MSNFADRKNLPHSVCQDFDAAFLEESEGSLILLDGENRVPTLRHQRVRHVRRYFGQMSLESLGALYARSDLLIGVDSGPYHYAKMFAIPTTGVWRHHIPSQCTLPNRHAINLVRRDAEEPAKWATRRSLWNQVEYDGEEVMAEDLVRSVRVMLGSCRIIGGEATAARDARFVGLLHRAARGGRAQFRDRHKTFEWTFREASRRFAEPVIVETGCIRSPEDWSADY